MHLFVIQRRSDGLYSTGGTHPSFNEVGKIWQRRDLSAHLAMHEGDCPYYDYCDVVEIEYKNLSCSSIADELNGRWLAHRRNARHAQKEAHREKTQKEMDLAEIARLQAKWE